MTDNAFYVAFFQSIVVNGCMILFQEERDHQLAVIFRTLCDVMIVIIAGAHV